MKGSGAGKSRERVPHGQLRLRRGCSSVWRGDVTAHHTESRWLGSHLLCAPRGLIPQILGYVHRFHTSASSRCGLGLEAVLMRGQLCSSLLDELGSLGPPAKQGSPKPGPVARGSQVHGHLPSPLALCGDLSSIAQMEGCMKWFWQVSRDLRWGGGAATWTICGKACPEPAGADALRAREGGRLSMHPFTLCHSKIIAECI